MLTVLATGCNSTVHAQWVKKLETVKNYFWLQKSTKYFLHQDIVKVKLGYLAEDWTFATCYL